MQKQNAISENQKHSTENTLKGAYQLKKKSPLRVFTTHGQLNKEMEIWEAEVLQLELKPWCTFLFHNILLQL